VVFGLFLTGPTVVGFVMIATVAGWALVLVIVDGVRRLRWIEHRRGEGCCRA
jgi:hypothetical protein